MSEQTPARVAFLILSDEPARALPGLTMAARMKTHGHWLTDTMAGAAVGVASGYFAHAMRSPFILGLLPGGFYVGLHERFE